MNRRVVILVIVVLAWLGVRAQDAGPDFDSLRADAMGEECDSLRLSKLYNFTHTYVQWNVDYDTAMKYIDMGVRESILQCNTTMLGKFYILKGWEYMYHGDPLAVDNFFKSVEVFESCHDSIQLVRAMYTIGAYYINTTRYYLAVDYTQMALNLALKYDVHDYDNRIYENMATVNYNLKLYNIAKDYYSKAMECSNDSGYVALCRMNMAECDVNTDTNTYQALLAEEEAYRRLSETDPYYTDQIFVLYNHILWTFESLDKSDSRRDSLIAKLEYWRPVLEAYTPEFSRLTMCSSLLQYYIISGDRKMADKMADNLLEGLDNDLLPHQSECYETMEVYYRTIGNWKLACKYIDKYIRTFAVECDIDISVQNEKSSAEIAYRDKVHQADIDSEKRDIRFEKDSEFNTVLWWCMGVVGLFLVGLLVPVVINYREQWRQEMQLARQTYEIKSASDMLLSQQAEILSQRDEIASQAQDLDLQLRMVSETNIELLWSISCAADIQRAMVPCQDDLRAMFPESFLYWRPLEMVSGDFCWLFCSGNRKYVVTADCTGHGVPGALVSMLGISYLNDMSHTMDSLDAGEILDMLRDRIAGVLSHSNDGMDLSLYIITSYELRNPNGHPDDGAGYGEHGEHGKHRITQNNTEEEQIKNQKLKIKNDPDEEIKNCKSKIKNELSYAGAKRPLWIVRNGELIELKPDKKSICVPHYDIENLPFSTQRLELEEGDMVYSFSDGIQDQIGGPDCKKFGRKNLKDLLVSLSDKPVDEQLSILGDTMSQWSVTCDIDDNKQVDDQILIGLRIAPILSGN